MFSGFLNTTMIINVLKSRKFLIAFAMLASLFCPIAAVASQMRDSQESYLALTLLNSERKIGNYLGDDNVVKENEVQSWIVDVRNSMPKTEYVTVKIKLLNSTHLGPDDSANTPSPESELTQFKYAISPDSHWQMPLDWSITGLERQDHNLIIKKMIINDQAIDHLNIQAVNGEHFRFVIELWTYDSKIDDFTFDWSSSSEEQRSVWNQIWFDVTE